MQLEVLGKSPAFQDKDGACSGYLLKHKNKNILLDCGSSVLGKLQINNDPLQLDAVFISHMHADHYLDLLPLAYYLYLHKAENKPLLFLPEGGLEILEDLTATWGDRELLSRVFLIQTYYKEQKEIDICGIKASLVQTRHPLFTSAIRIDDFVYGADSGWSESLLSFSRNADFIILDATLLEEDPSLEDVHMSYLQAAHLAEEAGCRKLLLTHFPSFYPQKEMQEKAENIFSGTLFLASQNLILDI